MTTEQTKARFETTIGKHHIAGTTVATENEAGGSKISVKLEVPSVMELSTTELFALQSRLLAEAREARKLENRLNPRDGKPRRRKK